jgi:dienelactone hydrolase
MSNDSPVCCPSNSHPSLADDYLPQGMKITHKSVEMYSVGSLSNNSGSAGSRSIVIFPDIWGWDSGRTRRYADLLVNNSICDTVLIPKLLIPTFEDGTDGDGLPPGIDLAVRPDVWPWLSQFSYQFLKSKIDDVFDFLQFHEQKTIGVMGVCYGGYLASYATFNYPNVTCMVVPHPTIHAEESLFGGNNVELAKKVCLAPPDLPDASIQIQVPVLLLPAASDPPCYLPGGNVCISSSLASFLSLSVSLSSSSTISPLLLSLALFSSLTWLMGSLQEEISKMRRSLEMCSSSSNS